MNLKRCWMRKARCRMVCRVGCHSWKGSEWDIHWLIEILFWCRALGYICKQNKSWLDGMCRLMQTDRQYTWKQVTYQVVIRYSFHSDTWIWLNPMKLPIYDPLTYKQVNFIRFNLLHIQTKWCKKKTDSGSSRKGDLRRRNADSVRSGLINFLSHECVAYSKQIFLTV